jgi:prephenate dehydrogenase
MSQPKVTIVGLDLIGTSMGLALRKAQSDFKVVGHDKDSALCRKAQELGAVEKWERNLISAVEDAELIIITTSVSDTKDVLQSTGPYLKANCVLTDTAPVKGDVMRWASEFLPETVHFVGGHPILRQQDRESKDASADLFGGATYCLIPSTTAHPAAIELVTSMVLALDAEPFFLDVEEHDGQVAGVEHLPILLSLALLLSTTEAPSWRDLRRLPGESFWRATKFPSAEPEINSRLCLSNKEHLSHWIDAYIDSLRALQDELDNPDEDEWHGLFADLMDTRARWMAGRGTPDEEATQRSMEELRNMTSLGSLLGLNQFRDLRKRMEDRTHK